MRAAAVGGALTAARREINGESALVAVMVRDELRERAILRPKRRQWP